MPLNAPLRTLRDNYWNVNAMAGGSLKRQRPGSLQTASVARDRRATWAVVECVGWFNHVRMHESLRDLSATCWVRGLYAVNREPTRDDPMNNGNHQRWSPRYSARLNQLSAGIRR
jgi:hypothetical protein